VRDHRDTYLEQQQTEKLENDVSDVDWIRFIESARRQTHRDTYLEQQQTEKLETAVRDLRDTYLEQQKTVKLETEVSNVDRTRMGKCTHAVQGGLLGGHKSAPVR
jgi:hypothetical protein